ncbi:uncharacterized protein OCT59_023375 [Rhizophagus irregularis]|uniref:uncharacterized protein n=1 Tax=Rhizophagus irregularis TaxID=588596 RepID=UPI003319264F|nr:hypothetical protein OCT59_023375 [Rhizophagus irregularis]
MRMMGGLIWADNEWKGYGRQYDVTSLYPSIRQSNANFPIQQGKFQILKDFVDHRGYALYGLFRAKVSGNDILFRQNKRGVYTFIDLQQAKKLGLDIQLIQDGKPNALIYDREARIPGTVIFGEYVHFLFNIKNQGGVAGRVAKRVLNTLWGALCQEETQLQDTHHRSNRSIQPSSPTLITCPENAYKALKALKFETAGYCHVKNANKVIWTAIGKNAVGFTVVHHCLDETVLKIIRALKDTIVVALVSGFSKTSYLVQDHVKYIKRIQTAKSPVSYVKFVARKLFPDNAAYTAKIAKIRESYKNKQALLDKLEALFELYYNVTKDSLTGPPKRAVTMNEAEKTLAELLV